MYNYSLRKLCKCIVREEHKIGIDGELVVFGYFRNTEFVEVHIPREDQKGYPIAIFLCGPDRDKELWGVKFEDIGKEVTKLHRYSQKRIRKLYRDADKRFPRISIE